MSDNAHYFIARGRSAEAVTNYVAAREEALVEGKAIMTRLGASNMYYQGSRLYGFGFTDSSAVDPKQLRRDPHNPGVWVPAARFKIGKALRDEMELYGSDPDVGDLMQALVGTVALFMPNPSGRGMVGATCGYEKLGDDWVITMPEDREGSVLTPIDAVPMKRSEYWSRREADAA